VGAAKVGPFQMGKRITKPEASHKKGEKLQGDHRGKGLCNRDGRGAKRVVSWGRMVGGKWLVGQKNRASGSKRRSTDEKGGGGGNHPTKEWAD